MKKLLLPPWNADYMVCCKSLARAGAGGTISLTVKGTRTVGTDPSICSGQPRKSRDYGFKAVRVSGGTMGLSLVAFYGQKAPKVVLVQW